MKKNIVLIFFNKIYLNPESFTLEKIKNIIRANWLFGHLILFIATIIVLFLGSLPISLKLLYGFASVLCVFNLLFFLKRRDEHQIKFKNYILLTFLTTLTFFNVVPHFISSYDLFYIFFFILIDSRLFYFFWVQQSGKKNWPANEKLVQLVENEIHIEFEKNLTVLQVKIKYPALFVFYRSWCPYCVGYIDELISNADDLQRRDLDVFLISMEPNEFIKKKLKKIPKGFHLISDFNKKVAEEINLINSSSVPLVFTSAVNGQDAFYPTTILIGFEKEIIDTYYSQDIYARPYAKMIMTSLDDYIFNFRLNNEVEKRTIDLRRVFRILVHDLNTPLMIVLSYFKRLKKRPE
jgi:peroxiredoxin